MTRNRKHCQWVALVMAALWCVFVFWATGCAPTRLPENYREALSVAAQGSAKDLRVHDSRAVCRELSDGYVKTLDLVCALLADDAKQGRGWWEALVGMAGLNSGPSGELDAVTAKACGEGK